MKERSTRQREAIDQVFAHSERALSLQEILAKAQTYVPELGVATVYRNIKRRVDEGYVVTVQLPGQILRYERTCTHSPSTGISIAHANTSIIEKNTSCETPQNPDHHHHYFHCRVCDGVFPVHACPGHLETLVPTGFQIESHDLTLYGKCLQCATHARSTQYPHHQNSDSSQ